MRPYALHVPVENKAIATRYTVVVALIVTLQDGMDKTLSATALTPHVVAITLLFPSTPLVADVVFTEPFAWVFVPVGVNPTKPETSHMPAVKLIDVTFAAELFVNDTPDAWVTEANMLSPMKPADGATPSVMPWMAPPVCVVVLISVELPLNTRPEYVIVPAPVMQFVFELLN